MVSKRRKIKRKGGGGDHPGSSTGGQPKTSDAGTSSTSNGNTIPPTQSYGYTNGGNSPQSEAHATQVKNQNDQQNLNSMNGGGGDDACGGGCSMPSKLTVVTFPPNNVTPVNANSNSLNSSTTLVQGNSDATGDTVPKSSPSPNQVGGCSACGYRGGRKRTKRKKSRRRQGGRTVTKWGCKSGGRKKRRKKSKKQRKYGKKNTSKKEYVDFIKTNSHIQVNV